MQQAMVQDNTTDDLGLITYLGTGNGAIVEEVQAPVQESMSQDVHATDLHPVEISVPEAEAAAAATTADPLQQQDPWQGSRLPEPAPTTVSDDSSWAL